MTVYQATVDRIETKVDKILTATEVIIRLKGGGA